MNKCTCGHFIYDHKASNAGIGLGECGTCWCGSFVARVQEVETPDIMDYTALSHKAPVIEMIVERLERKACPQGLNVMAEELQWIGHSSATYDKIVKAVKAELAQSRPRILAVSEGIYWLAERSIPAGWSPYGKAMLPCFYREYPPEVSWDELELPANIMPHPEARTHPAA